MKAPTTGLLSFPLSFLHGYISSASRILATSLAGAVPTTNNSISPPSPDSLFYSHRLTESHFHVSTDSLTSHLSGGPSSQLAGSYVPAVKASGQLRSCSYFMSNLQAASSAATSHRSDTSNSTDPYSRIEFAGSK
ncbi:unnamed protein product [Protopolystoma xenopodis]|uniref:Uncharacterized protein n=1 Tax=Protopolystoma xenopodis TaxID=117903 RepID=A0A448WE95_9PLAT|nr:unnamed protein product [Protopolystoma xenopodis]